MTRWWWVRHGPTHQRAFTGWRDVPADLSDEAQILRLADFLPANAVVISSDLLRARSTADAIQGDRPRLPHNRDLREFNFGVWDGVHFEQVSEQYPDLSRQYWEQPGDVRPPDGESWNDAATRTRAVVDHLNSEGHKDIIAVAHFGIILTQIQRASGKSAYEALSHEVDPLSVTEIVHDDGQWQLGAINHIP